MVDQPHDVVAVARTAESLLATALHPSAGTGSRADWADATASLQRVIDVASAAQDSAIARLAAIEPEELEDGTVAESHRALGHVALDAPAIVSGVLVVSALHAERRVRTAVRLAADGPAGSTTETGLRGLHEAMGSGRLDAYRAGVVADELEEAPAEVRATVVAAVEPHLLTEDAAHLRRRCRRALARISPDLLRQRAQRARAESGLRRWADEPGVDRWEGTFPSEEAAQAWAAIDGLARRYVSESVCSTLERARAKALTDLVAGNATVETVVTLTVPAAAVPGAGPTGARADEADLVEVTGPGSGSPFLASRRWLASTLDPPASASPVSASVEVAGCHPETGALLDLDAEAATERGPGDCATVGGPSSCGTVDGPSSWAAAVGDDRYRPSRRLAELVRARDRRCRFPGCTVAAVFCDLDHVRPWPLGPTSAHNLICLCRRHHRVKQRPGWVVRLADDGVVTWTDPTGRTRVTLPVDALHPTVLSCPPVGAAAGPDADGSARAEPHVASLPRTVLPDGPHSHLEFVIEHHAAGRPVQRTTGRKADSRHRPDIAPPRGGLVLGPAGWTHRPTPQRARRRHAPDPPPF